MYFLEFLPKRHSLYSAFINSSIISGSDLASVRRRIVAGFQLITDGHTPLTLDDGDWPLQFGQWVSPLTLAEPWSNSRKAAHYFVVEVPPNSTRLTVQTDGGNLTGSGVDIYVKQGNRVQSLTETGVASSTGSSNEEFISIENPVAGHWFIALPTSASYEGVRLLARVETGAPATLPKGRIAFHRDSDNYNAPHVPTSPDDGHVFIYDLVNGGAPRRITDGQPVKSAMNPHFSPDGRMITFMAIPSGQSLAWANMHVYALDLSVNAITNLGPGQDPKFSPDGSRIVFKGWDSQIWDKPLDGGEARRLTSSSGEKSGPNYSPDGGKIVFWLNAKENADVWLMNSDGSGQTPLIATPSIQDYYPIFRDSDNVLFARWDSATDPHPDKIYNVRLSTGDSHRLGLNSEIPNVEDADGFALGEVIGFSSTRQNGWPDYDLFFGDESGAAPSAIAEANTDLGELGGTYTASTYSRSIQMVSPTGGGVFSPNSEIVLKLRLFSDGQAWQGASPSVTIQGSVNVTHENFNDDGSAGDEIAGDGVYSKTVIFPALTGTYSMSASVPSIEPSATRMIVSPSVSFAVLEHHTPPSIQLAPTRSLSDFLEVRLNTRRSGTIVSGSLSTPFSEEIGVVG